MQVTSPTSELAIKGGSSAKDIVGNIMRIIYEHTEYEKVLTEFNLEGSSEDRLADSEDEMEELSL